MAKLQKKRIEGDEEIGQILARFWGHTEFRPLQEEIILSVLSQRDTLALMPTGGGKSVTFQVPTMAREGICIVITPLIALMKDQVDRLTARGIKAAAIHSGMTRHEIDVTLDNCVFGGVKFLYVSPERLSTELFRIRVADMPVSMITVDEAHCISQWGYDFRPSYLEISALREVLKGVPVLALTATATPEVCEDIQERLLFREKNLLRMSFDRKNLAYLVRKSEDKLRELATLVGQMEGSGIIYARNRRKCREVAQLLAGQGHSADFYHAGLKHELREERQRGWTEDRFRIMVATNAFGMGIDKPDVRFVIHLDLPDAPEAYFQEAGRAGRDGKESRAILLFSPSDLRRAEQRIDINFPGIPRIREVYRALCNYLQIPLGSGKGQQYDFEMDTFLQRYRLSAVLAYSALNILAREGYIALTEAFDNPSRIKFRLERDDLYSFQVKHEDFDSFIKLLLRSYSGLFTQYVRIDEQQLARRSGMPAQRISGYLKALSTRQVIHYIPRREVPVITFLEERLDEKNLLIAPDRYHFRRERFVKRIHEILRYASSETICRNQYLLSYFGQMDSPRCGRCDTCTAGKGSDPVKDDPLEVRERIRSQLAESSQSLYELVRGTGDATDQVVEMIELMVDEGTIVRGEDLKFSLKG